MNILLNHLPSVAFIASVIGTALVLTLLRRARVMDKPNARSNHKTPVPRGGGIAMIAVALTACYYAGIPVRIIASGGLLAVVSFIDDLRPLPASLRFAAQALAVAFALPALAFYTQDYSALTLIAIALLWIWFINLTNFMDGIDGISAMQAIMQMTGIILISHLQQNYMAGLATAGYNPTTHYNSLLMAYMPGWLPLGAAILATSALGFLCFNLSPAKLFMGDVGSIPLGFLGGYLLLSLAGCGFWAAALILPAYYLTDATLTLLLRAKRREKVWQAHSQHAYQQAVRRGMSHNQVVGRITFLNILLVILALVSTISMMAGILTCVAGYALALYFFRHLIHAPFRH